jgi:hypothetical protein
LFRSPVELLLIKSCSNTAAAGAVPYAARRRRRANAAGTRPDRAGQRRIHAARPHQRLHRLLHRYPPRHHGGQAVRLDNPLLPNDKWVPISYHDRSSSVVVSGTPVRRPLGQTKGRDDTPPFGLSQRMDCELELGFLMGPGNALAASVLACAAQRCCPRLPCTDLSPPAPLLRKGRRPALVAPPLRSTARPVAATRSRACRAGHPR